MEISPPWVPRQQEDSSVGKNAWYSRLQQEDSSVGKNACCEGLSSTSRTHVHKVWLFVLGDPIAGVAETG